MRTSKPRSDSREIPERTGRPYPSVLGARRRPSPLGSSWCFDLPGFRHTPAAGVQSFFQFAARSLGVRHAPTPTVESASAARWVAPSVVGWSSKGPPGAQPTMELGHHQAAGPGQVELLLSVRHPDGIHVPARAQIRFGGELFRTGFGRSAACAALYGLGQAGGSGRVAEKIRSSAQQPSIPSANPLPTRKRFTRIQLRRLRGGGSKSRCSSGLCGAMLANERAFPCKRAQRRIPEAHARGIAKRGGRFRRADGLHHL